MTTHALRFAAALILTFGGVVVVAQDRGGTTTLSRPLQISQKSAPIPGRYIVMVDTAANVDAVADYVRSQLGGTVDSLWRNAVYGFGMQASDAAAQQLAWDQRVIEIAQDDYPQVAACPVVQAYPDHSCADGSIPWQMDLLDGALDGQYHYSWAGDLSKIYILDTGIQASHPEFNGRVLDGHSWIAGEPSTVDADSHGTVAASVAGGLHAGAAKDAALISVRLMRRGGDASIATWIDAVNWTLRDIQCIPPDRTTPGCVGNLGSAYPVVYLSATFSGDKTFQKAVSSVVATGATVVGPAGNTAGNSCSNGLANVPGVIIVGAVQRSGGGLAIWPSSATGGCITLFAPGFAVGVGYVGGYDCSPGWQGTSWSAASAAGVAANFYDQFGGNVKAKMLEYAKPGAIQGDLRGAPNLLLQSIPPSLGCVSIQPPPYQPPQAQ